MKTLALSHFNGLGLFYFLNLFNHCRNRPIKQEQNVEYSESERKINLRFPINPGKSMSEKVNARSF